MLPKNARSVLWTSSGPKCSSMKHYMIVSQLNRNWKVLSLPRIPTNQTEWFFLKTLVLQMALPFDSLGGRANAYTGKGKSNFLITKVHFSINTNATGKVENKQYGKTTKKTVRGNIAVSLRTISLVCTTKRKIYITQIK